MWFIFLILVLGGFLFPPLWPAAVIVMFLAIIMNN